MKWSSKTKIMDKEYGQQKNVLLFHLFGISERSKLRMDLSEYCVVAKGIRGFQKNSL